MLCKNVNGISDEVGHRKSILQFVKHLYDAPYYVMDLLTNSIPPPLLGYSRTRRKGSACSRSIVCDHHNNNITQGGRWKFVDQVDVAWLSLLPLLPNLTMLSVNIIAPHIHTNTVEVAAAAVVAGHRRKGSAGYGIIVSLGRPQTYIVGRSQY